MSVRIYLDNCCYNRPFDNMLSDRIRIESEAIMAIIKIKEKKKIELLGSDILEVEMSKIADTVRLQKVKVLYQTINEVIPYSEEIKDLSNDIMANSSIKLYDSLHLASAIIGKAQYFMTTDDKFYNSCQKLNLDIKVVNPVIWLMEVIGNE